MSQAGITSTTSGPSPPDVATTYTADSGNSATPAVNILLVHSNDTINNNLNGIQSRAGITDSLLGNEVLYQLTNRTTGTVTTVGAVSDDVISFDVTAITPALTSGVFNFSISVNAWDSANSNGSTWKISGAMKYDGVGALATIGTPTRTMNGEDPPFDVTLVDVSFVGSTVSVEVTGIAGRTISWTGLITYLFGG